MMSLFDILLFDDLDLTSPHATVDDITFGIYHRVIFPMLVTVRNLPLSSHRLSSLLASLLFLACVLFSTGP